jgi:hypothetical protein
MVHAGLDIRIARLADGGDAPALQADVRLDDAPMVEDERIGDAPFPLHLQRACFWLCRHAVADGLCRRRT